MSWLRPLRIKWGHGNKFVADFQDQENEVDKVIRDIAKKYGVEILRDEDESQANRGACSLRTIYLGIFDDADLELVAFFHELGHVLSNERVCKRGHVMTKLSGEGLAWELGLGIAFEYGYDWGYFSKQIVWAREQFGTYQHDQA